MNKTIIRQFCDTYAYEEFIDSGDWTIGEVKCFESSQRRNDPSKPIYVAVVETTRHYGGPEEGGWYYDWHQVVETKECYTFRHLLWWVKELRRVFPTCHRDRGSVIGGADVTIYMLRHEHLIKQLQSSEVPKYS